MHWTAPQKFTLNRWCMLSRLPPAIGANSPTPALFTSTSTLSNSSTVRRTSASTAKRSVTSVGTTRRRPGKSASSGASSSSLSRLRAARTTWARLRANSRAVSRPIPEDAPVMITVRPSTCNRPSSNGAYAEPLRELGPQPEPGVAPGDQAHVPALQDDVLLLLGAQQRRQRLRRADGGDVVVLGHDVQRRAGDSGQVHPPAAQGKLPLNQLVLPHQLLDQLAVRFAGEGYLVVHPAVEQPVVLHPQVIPQVIEQAGVGRPALGRTQHLERAEDQV